MTKKKLSVIVASLLIVLGIGYGNYMGVSHGSEATQIAKTSTKHATKKAAKATTIASDSKTKKNTKVTNAKDAKAKATSKKVAANALTKQAATVAKATAKTAASNQAATVATTPGKDQGNQPKQGDNAVNTNPKPAVPTPAPTAQTEEVKLSIYGPISDGNQKWLNSDVVSMKEGESVFDVLKHDLESKGIKLSKSGTGSTTYVRGINGMFEFDKGPLSGWLYRVNGVFPNHSCGDYYVKSGDVIDWMYTEDLGNDRNAPQV